MIILGLNAYHADASACLVVNGQLVAAAEEERFCRVKHWAGLPARAVGACLISGRIRRLRQLDDRDGGGQSDRSLEPSDVSPLTRAILSGHDSIPWVRQLWGGIQGDGAGGLRQAGISRSFTESCTSKAKGPV